MSKGKLIVLEGLDGSGKATQAKLLAEHLAAQGVPVQKITFPDYASDSSALVKMYLSGEFGQHPDDVNAYAASSFYAVDRYASYKTSWGSFYEQGGVIIADRYTTSNAVHQCSKLPQEQWEEYLHWLFDYEFRLLGLPAPDRVIYLQVDPAVSQRRRVCADEPEWGQLNELSLGSGLLKEKTALTTAFENFFLRKVCAAVCCVWTGK